MQEMVELLRATNALQIPILKIKTTVEETYTTVEKSKRIVEDIFKTIEGTYHLQIHSPILTGTTQPADGSRF